MTTQQRYSAGTNLSPAKSVWRLRSAKEKLVECSVQQTVSKLYAVIVVLGAETLLDERYPDSASAMQRATQVRDRLLESGGWTA